MKVGIAGPVALPLLAHLVEQGEAMGEGYSFPFTAHLIMELLRRDHEVAVFALDPALEDPAAFRGHRLTVRVSPYRPRHRARDFFAVERQHLRTAMREESCDVIHALWTYEFALAALSVDGSSLVTFQDWAPTILKLMPTPYRFMRLLMNWRVLRTGENFTVISPYLERRVARWATHKPAVIPNAVPLRGDPPDRHAPRGEAVVVGSVNAGFSRRKNVITLLSAFPAVRARTGALLKLAGDGYEAGGAAHQWAIEKGLAEGVSFEGRLSPAQVDDFYDEVHVLVHPSLEEAFGVTLIEAMSRGVPVIAGERSGAVPWVLDYGRSGRLVDVSSASAIADASLELLQHPSEWQRFSEAGLGTVRKRFDIRAVAALYEQRYMAIASALRGNP